MCSGGSPGPGGHNDYGGEFGCLIVLITPLGRVGRRDALGADLSIVSSTDWHIMSQSSQYFSLVLCVMDETFQVVGRVGGFLFLGITRVLGVYRPGYLQEKWLESVIAHQISLYRSSPIKLVFI